MSPIARWNCTTRSKPLLVHRCTPLHKIFQPTPMFGSQWIHCTLGPILSYVQFFHRNIGTLSFPHIWKGWVQHKVKRFKDAPVLFAQFLEIRHDRGLWMQARLTRLCHVPHNTYNGLESRPS